MTDSYIHPTAVVEPKASIGEGVKIWHFCHVRDESVIEKDVSLGKGVYVDSGVRIGMGSRIQNGVSVYRGVTIGEWCFIGPHVVFTNDLTPRAGNKAWKVINTWLGTGMSIGAGAIIRCGVSVGAFAVVGAGAIVTKSVLPFHLAVGCPATSHQKICACGQELFPLDVPKEKLLGACCKQNMNSDLYLIAKEYMSSKME